MPLGSWEVGEYGILRNDALDLGTFALNACCENLLLDPTETWLCSSESRGHDA